METMTLFGQGFSVALTPQNLMLAVAGCILGTIIGALPGLGPSNGVAILIPLAFSLELDATAALVLMTTLDGYPMAKAGRAADALVLSGVASFVGALLATFGLILMAPILASIAYKFGPAEYFALYLLAFVTLGGLTDNNQAKAIVAACIGLAIATIGGNSSGTPRLSFDSLYLYDGVNFLVAIVGLFAVTEVFVFIETSGKNTAIGVKIDKMTIPWRDIVRTSGTMLRGTVIGFVAGILPGAGASLGSFLAYSAEKAIAKDKSQFGKGDVRGVVAPEAGNNAAGPTLFSDRPEVVWGLIAALLISNVVLLILNVPMVKIFVKILMVPPWVLLPGVTMVSFVGIYSVSSSWFDLLLMIGFSALGFFLRKLDIPTVPIILDILLGSHIDNALQRAMVISGGEWQYLFSSKIAIGLWVAAVLGFIAPMCLRKFLEKPEAVPD